ncbi:MAG TPA: hypothetical protein DCZ08_02615, partial [Anaerolineaceae bacterium]|nr:hypothetical protein [Anaerolineaceae bacterium]
MRIPKLLPLLAVFAMLAGVLAACAPSATPTAAPVEPTAVSEATQAPVAEQPTAVPPAEPVKLTFWFNWEGTNADVMKDLVNRFNEQNPDIVVEPVFQPYADIMTLYQTAIVGGT